MTFASSVGGVICVSRGGSGGRAFQVFGPGMGGVGVVVWANGSEIERDLVGVMVWRMWNRRCFGEGVDLVLEGGIVAGRKDGEEERMQRGKKERDKTLRKGCDC